jgi:uncharacterized integral membrane protein
MEPAGTQEPGTPPDPQETVARALKSARRLRFGTRLALGVVVTVAIVLLIVQNGRSAHLSWLAFHFSPPLWIMLLLTAAAGAVAWEVMKAASRRARRVRREHREAVQAAQEMTRR